MAYTSTATRKKIDTFSAMRSRTNCRSVSTSKSHPVGVVRCSSETTSHPASRRSNKLSAISALEAVMLNSQDYCVRTAALTVVLWSVIAMQEARGTQQVRIVYLAG
eukprot:7297605-Prymnesium_polylepis.1